MPVIFEENKIFDVYQEYCRTEADKWKLIEEYTVEARQLISNIQGFINRPNDVSKLPYPEHNDAYIVYALGAPNFLNHIWSTELNSVSVITHQITKDNHTVKRKSKEIAKNIEKILHLEPESTSIIRGRAQTIGEKNSYFGTWKLDIDNKNNIYLVGEAQLEKQEFYLQLCEGDVLSYFHKLQNLNNLSERKFKKLPVIDIYAQKPAMHKTPKKLKENSHEFLHEIPTTSSFSEFGEILRTN